MHVKTYPTFLTPRDEKPSLSSSKEKSSEFGWLEIKMKEETRIYMKNRASALFLDSIYLSIYFYITYLITVDAREFIQEGNLPFLGYFLAKELHEWLNTRRKWKFIQKYLKKRSKRVGA